jgi:hypothetical protein
MSKKWYPDLDCPHNIAICIVTLTKIFQTYF